MDLVCRASRAAALSVVLAGLVLCLAGCVRVPLADDLAQGPRVDEIVRRVKCDLYEAVGDRLNAPYGYEWLHAWTAQANLNLIVNDQSILSPGAVITEPLHAVTVPKKVTNFGQSFNFGLGASANNTATRNETITFTVSLDELTEQFGKGQHNCDFPNYIDLRSELGLREWISASLKPVEDGDLKIGYHKPPRTGAGSTSAKASIEAAATAVSPPVPTRGAKGIRCDIPSTIPPRSSGPPSAANVANDLPNAYCDLVRFFALHTPGAIDLSKPLDGAQVQFIALTISDLQRAVADLTFMNDPTDAAAMGHLERAAIDLAVFVDPPLDLISHQTQFIIVWNASASPSWTLLNFKGPSPSSGAFFSATKTKTHTLNVVIGPPSNLDTQGALNALQTGTAVGNAIATSGLVPP